MRRREFIAGAVSAGAVGTAGALHVFGMPFGSTVGEEPAHGQVSVSGVEATGSVESSVTLPANDTVTFVDLFATTCTVCQRQMPALGEAADSLPDVKFVSVTAERESFVDNAGLAEWWDEYDGSWQVARDDSYDFVRHYSRATPTAVIFDANGMVRFEETGRKSAEEIIEEIEAVKS